MLTMLMRPDSSRRLIMRALRRSLVATPNSAMSSLSSLALMLSNCFRVMSRGGASDCTCTNSDSKSTFMNSDFVRAPVGGVIPISLMTASSASTLLASSSLLRYRRLRPAMRIRRSFSKSASSVGISKRQIGQVQRCSSQELMHALWKMWPQESLVAFCPSSCSSMQTQHESLPSASMSTLATVIMGRFWSVLFEAGGAPCVGAGAGVSIGTPCVSSSSLMRPSSSSVMRPRISAMRLAACCAWMPCPAPSWKTSYNPSTP
mmetsp:Transcript_23179/g.72311  ORF Transcript_23179/g.72311 Transcript_23179/m.72311 type:complete len:261 (-) Transcript_23179:393-1175(-)